MKKSIITLFKKIGKPEILWEHQEHKLELITKEEAEKIKGGHKEYRPIYSQGDLQKNEPEK